MNAIKIIAASKEHKIKINVSDEAKIPDKMSFETSLNFPSSLITVCPIPNSKTEKKHKNVNQLTKKAYPYFIRIVKRYHLK